MHRICKFSAFSSHFQVTSGRMTSLPGHLRSRDVISCHMSPSPCELKRLGSELYTIRHFYAFYSQFQVTTGQMTSHPGHLRSPAVT